ncbi:MAG TPA: hypothetical protein DCL64_06515 [Ruminococcaceae bacterium]|nr:hypothetical protein [Oscillospiraceae bacterium]
MDIFVEQIVKKKFGPRDYGIAAATVVVGLALIFLSLQIPPIVLLVTVGVCFAAYYIISSRNLEFEYSVTNGDITIDKIINRRRRKRVISVDAREIEEMGRFHPDLLRRKAGCTRVFTSRQDSGGEWYFCAHHPQKGNVLVVFDPEEKVLKAIRPFLRGQVAFVAFGRN